MPRKTTRSLPDPRIWSPDQVASRLGRSPGWLYERMPRLKQLGFPRKDEVLGGWDSKAVENWLDRRAGLETNANIEDQMLEAIHGENHAALR
jgi:predicted DNA-binding transcriptional regulator AlpA